MTMQRVGLGVMTCLAMVACGGTTTPMSTPVTAPLPTPSPAPAPARIGPSPATTPTATQRLVDSLVALPQFSNAHWGVLIVAPDRRDTLASVRADQLVMPASNMKIITAAVGLTQLGPEFSWRTTFTRTGPIVRGVVRGDVVVEGRGDPSISSAMRGDPMTAFGPLVEALRAAGVRRIAGRIRSSDAAAFPGSPLGFGWDWDDLDAPYGAGVTELMFNEAFTDVHVVGCAASGRAACVTTTPLGTSPVIHSQVVVRAAGSGAPQLTWWRDSAAVPGITIRGSIARGDSTSFEAAHPDDRNTYLAAVTEALRRGGITVGGGRVVSGAADTVVVLRSPPLRDVVGAMMKPSQNQVAEALFRTIALERSGAGLPDSARALVERQLADWGVRSDAFAIRDGSGLSRHDYLTPHAVAQVLDVMRRGPTFSAFYEALPIAGLDGTLRNRMRGFAQGRVRAKTGTIDKARALSGYVTTADGEMLIFSIIANNFSVSNREIDRATEQIVEHLVNMRRSAP